MASGGDEERGTSRLLLKLKEAIDARKFYEAHQLMRSINVRYQNSNRIPELEALLINTANILLDTEQYESGSDVANMLTKLYLENKIPVREDRILSLANLVEKMRDSPERTTFIGSTMEWSSNMLDSSGAFNTVVARIFIKQELYQEAWKHVVRMTDVPLMSKFVLEIISKSSIPNAEIDLVIAILVLTLLVGKRLVVAESAFSELTKAVGPSSTNSPLINGLRFIIEASKSPSTSVFNSIKQIYLPSFSREPNVLRLFLSIGRIIFKIPVPNKNTQRNGFMANLLSAFAQPDSPQGQQPGPSSDTEPLTLD